MHRIVDPGYLAGWKRVYGGWDVVRPSMMWMQANVADRVQRGTWLSRGSVGWK
jgi:hypothetical protein